MECIAHISVIKFDSLFDGICAGNGRNVHCRHVLYFMGMLYFLTGIATVNEHLEQ